MGILVKEISTFENMFIPILYCINTKFSMKNHMKVGIPMKNCLENGLFSLVRNTFKKFYHTIKMKSCFTVSHCAFSLWKHIQYSWCNNISLTDWLTEIIITIALYHHTGVHLRSGCIHLHMCKKSFPQCRYRIDHIHHCSEHTHLYLKLGIIL